MSRFGLDLMLVFLSNAHPGFQAEDSDEASWDDIVHALFDRGEPIKRVADAAGNAWTPEAVDHLDEVLMGIAATGQIPAELDLAPATAVELWRRWKYGIVGAQLESAAGHRLNIPSPRKAPDEVKSWALILFALGGPAKAYPAAMHEG